MAPTSANTLQEPLPHTWWDTPPTRTAPLVSKRLANDTLKGESNYASWIDVLNSYSGAGTAGNDVKLTINSTIQKAAQDSLKGYKGACVAIDPKTGAILALASSPTYDADDVDSILSSGGDSSALYNRATQALYSPGSTFKIVTLTTALADNVATESTQYDSPSTLDIGGGKVTNFNNSSYGTITLQRATELSANTVFAQLGDQIGAKDLVSSSEKFGFNNALSFDLPLAKSLMPDPDEMTEWETAWAAAGEPVGEPCPAPRARRQPFCRWPWLVAPSQTMAPSCSLTW